MAPTDNSEAVKAANAKLRGHYAYLNGKLLKDVARDKLRLTEMMARGGGKTEFERLEADAQKLTKQMDDVYTTYTHLVEELLDPQTETVAIETAMNAKEGMIEKMTDALDTIHATSLMWLDEVKKRKEAADAAAANAETTANPVVARENS